MSLRRALEGIRSDRETVTTLREVLAMIRHHSGEPLLPADIARAVGRDAEIVAPLLEVLAAAFVLDFDSASGRYIYSQDTLLDVEIDRYVRRTDEFSGRAQNNLERFRRRYGDR